MQRVKNFDSTGIAPNGILYSGDLNAMQDAAAALTDYTQTVAVSALAVGESGLQLMHYTSGEARMSGAMRTDGIFRGLGGLYAGAFTTTQRNAIASGFRPYGLTILNTTTNQLEWNYGTDAAPIWGAVSSDGTGYVNAPTGFKAGTDTTIARTGTNTLTFGTPTQPATLVIGSTAQPGAITLYGTVSTGVKIQFFNGADTQPRFTTTTSGTMSWGAGGASAPDTSLARSSAGILTVTNTLNAVSGFQVNGVALAASHLSNGVTGTGAVVLASAPIFTGNVGVGGAPAAAGGAAGSTILSTGGIILSKAANSVIFSATAPGDTVFAFTVDNRGLMSWGTGAAAVDTTMYRSAAGVLSVNGYVNAINGYQLNGTALTFNAPTRTVYTSGSGTYNTPAGCKAIMVECTAGGGAGGAAQTGSLGGTVAVGPGGNGGGYAVKLIANPAASYSYQVGAGGIGNPSGTNGGDSWFGGTSAGTSLVAAPGGGAAPMDQQDVSGSAPPRYTNPITGTIGTMRGDATTYGELGSPGIAWSTTAPGYWGGKGGKGAGPFGGPGGLGATGYGTGGNAETVYGGGGGGASSTPFGGGPQYGGNGAGGIIIITEFYN